MRTSIARASRKKNERDDERNEHAMMLIPKPYLASLEYGLISSPPPTSIPPPSPPPPMLSLLGASPYPFPPPLDGSAPPRLLRLIANNFVVASFTFPSLASRTERTTIGSRSGNMSSSVRHAASKDGSLMMMIDVWWFCWGLLSFIRTSSSSLMRFTTHVLSLLSPRKDSCLVSPIFSQKKRQKKNVPHFKGRIHLGFRIEWFFFLFFFGKKERKTSHHR